VLGLTGGELQVRREGRLDQYLPLSLVRARLCER
jgi:hypothetical protein